MVIQSVLERIRCEDVYHSTLCSKYIHGSHGISEDKWYSPHKVTSLWNTFHTAIEFVYRHYAECNWEHCPPLWFDLSPTFRRPLQKRSISTPTVPEMYQNAKQLQHVMALE